MCQLLAVNSSKPADLGQFFDVFAERGGRTDEHKDGWGIAFHSGKRCRLFTDHRACVESPLAARIRGASLRARNILAHIRKATQGRIALENSHPFARKLWGQTWSFAHNGDLKEFAPVLHGPFRPVGTTDSEQAFCLILQELSERFGDTCPPLPILRAQIERTVRSIAGHGTFNLMLSDGRAMFAHCSTHLHYIVRQYPFDTAKLSDEDVSVDFSQVTTPNDRVAVIVTQPLTTNEQWTAFAPGEMKCFVDGLPQKRDFEKI